MKLWNYIFRDDFVKKSLMFFVVTGFISFLNYVYHPVIGRIVSVSDFGEIEALFSLYNVFGIFLFAFTSVVIHVTANKDNENERNLFLAKIGVIGIAISFVLAIITTIASPLLKSVFHFQSSFAFIIFASLLPIATYVFFGAAFFQAQKKVSQYSIAHAIVSVAKLGVALGALYLGTRVAGTMTAFLIAQIAGAIYISRVLKNKIQLLKNVQFTSNEKNELAREVRYGLMILIANFSVILFCNGDILAVKYFFEPNIAGFYSGISAIGNIVYFVTAPIAAMLLASVKLKNQHNENNRILFLALGACFVLVGLAVLIFGFWHSIIITILLGQTFAEYSVLLRPISIFMGLAALYNIMLMYFLAQRKKIVFLPALASFLALVITLSLRHKTLSEVVYSFIFAIMVGIILAVLTLLTEYHKHNNAPRI